MTGASPPMLNGGAVAVLINPGGGSVGADQSKLRAIGDALAGAGIDSAPELVDGGAIAERARAAVESGAELLIVGGGDGTVGAAAGALAGSDTALGILPLGTLNHFARDLGIPLGLAEAAELIAGGVARTVDIAEMNGRIFVNNSAIGLYPHLVIDRESQQDRLGRGKRLAMAVAALRTLARFHRQRLTLAVNDEKARLDTPLLFVGNNRYRMALPGPGRRDSLDDGELCVMVMRRKTRTGFVAAMVRALAGRARAEDMVYIDGVTRLRVTGPRRLAVSLDGETIHITPPIDYRLRPRALKVIAPQPATSQAM
ncbi:MAG TPA: diacylglycerol kinase family protein [Sphingomicrobium sp.]|nr:diacylglycerol kinase family protein [Sphingomicrobium sp.]